MALKAPEHWRRVKLKEVADLIRSTVNPQNQPNKMFNYLSIGNIERNTGQLIDFIPTLGREIKSIKHLFAVQDVLYSRLRPNLNKVFLPDFEGICATDLLPLRPKHCILKEYLGLYLRSPFVVKYATSRMHGIQLPRLSTDALMNLDVLLPSMEEQRRIVAWAQSILGRSRVAKQELRRTPELIKRLRMAILSRAFRGELVGTQLDGVPAQVEPPDIYTGELPEIPSRWIWTTLKHLLREPLRNGKSARRAESNAGIPVLTLSAVTFKDFGPNNVKMCSMKEDQVHNLWVKDNDIFIARSNTKEYVGMAAMYNGPDNQFVFPDLMIRVRAMVSLILSRFLAFYLDSDIPRSYFRKNARSTAGSMPKINQTHIMNLPVPLAPLAEQQNIVSRLESLMLAIGRLEDRAIQAEHQLEQLDSATLINAFTGRLASRNTDRSPAISQTSHEKMLHQSKLDKFRNE